MAPSTTGRCGPKGGPIGPFTGGSNGSIRAHISSVNTAVRDMHPRSRLQHAQLVRHALGRLTRTTGVGEPLRVRRIGALNVVERTHAFIASAPTRRGELRRAHE